MTAFRITWLSSDSCSRARTILNDTQYRVGISHLAYLSVAAYRVTCPTSPCGRLSRLPLVGRHSHDYYWDSVALGLAPRRPSHVPSLPNVESEVGSALMPLDGFISHRPVIKACPRRKINRELSRASAYRRATDGCERSTPGHCGSGNSALALSLRRCRAVAYTSSATPRFNNMLLSLPPFGSR